MKKIIFSCILLLSAGLLPAEDLFRDKLPDNMYFKAMKKEMDRSIKRLRLKDSPNPYYMAYKVSKVHTLLSVEGSMGALYAPSFPTTNLQAWVLVSVGNDTQDSLSMEGFKPISASYVSDSYDGLRQDLWTLTDLAYKDALDAYKQKQTYYRQKQITDRLPDVVPAPQGRWAGPILQATSFEEDLPVYEDWVRAISAQGNKYPYIEDFNVQIDIRQKDIYYLNSRGGFYQYAIPYLVVWMQVQFRTKDGIRKKDSELLRLKGVPDNLADLIAQKAVDLLVRVQQTYEANQAEAYVGPVLLRPQAAAELIDRLFVKEMNNQTPLLSTTHDLDESAGSFANRLGRRVMSNVVDVYDDPTLMDWNDTYLLDGFSPIDDEGVVAQPLTLVSDGVLQEIARSTRPLKKGTKSNGHARADRRTFPREQLSNVIVATKTPLSQEELTDKLLARCRELEMEYCYLIDVLPMGGNTGSYTSILRIYTKDGSMEPVNGLEIQGLTGRALRDILAAGDDVQVFPSYESSAPASIVVPSLLLEELELSPIDLKPDRQPFLKRP